MCSSEKQQIDRKMSNSELDKVFRLKDEKDWVLWKFQVTILLKFHEAYSYATGEIKPPCVSAKEEEKTKFEKGDIKAQRAIMTTIDREPLMHIVNCKTAAEMWEKLKSVFEKKSETSVHFLQQRFFSYEKEPNDNIAMYISKLQEIVQQLADQGENISEKMVITKILMSLPQLLNHFRSAWDATAEEKRTLNELCARLMIEESRTNSNEQLESALLARRSNFKRDEKKNKRFRSGKCYICGSQSHFRKDCPDRNEKDGDALCCVADFKVSEKDAWYNDSGATQHMSGRREWFKNYIELEVPRSVRIGNGDVIYAVGKGDIDVRVFNGKRWIDKHLADAWYVPSLFVNLFSQGKCLDKGLTMEANSNECVFKRGNEVIAIGKRETGLYKMLIETKIELEEHAFIASGETLRSWHERLAHQNIAQVKRFLNGNNIKFKNEENFQCEACIFGKHHRSSFRGRNEKSIECGELIHSDVCGPIQVKSLGGARYFLLLKDDYSHYRHVYFLKQKDEVPSKVISFVKYIEKQTKYKVKRFRSDNGGEYVNTELSNFFVGKGIKHERTIPYTPEHNGSCERENRTIVEAARTMIHSNNLQLNLWAEAVNTAVYVLNRTGTSTVTDKTPFELWFNKSVRVDNLKVFGTIVFSHIPKQKRRKLDRKAEKCFLIGYSDEQKGFRVYNTEKRSVEVVRDVIFKKENRENLKETEKRNDDNVFEYVSFDEGTEKGEEPARSDSSGEDNRNEMSNDTPTVNHVSSVVQNVPNQSVTLDQRNVITVQSSDSEDFDSDEGNIEPIQEPVRDGSEICNVTQRNVIDSRLRSVNTADYAAICDMALFGVSDEPSNYKEAINSSEKHLWEKAMDEEYDSLLQNNTWCLVDPPKNQSVIDNRWIYKIKRKPDGSVERYKARLVVRGFTQQFGVNYSETFSPVVRYSSIRAILAIAAARNMKLFQFDVKTAFLYGDLKEDVYMFQPEGYNDNSGKVCKLIKSLYGLKHASRCWNKKFTQFIKDYYIRKRGRDDNTRAVR